MNIKGHEDDEERPVKNEAVVTGISRGCHFPNCWRNTTIHQIVGKKCGRRERVGKTSHRSRHLLNVGRMMKGEGLGTRCMYTETQNSTLGFQVGTRCIYTSKYYLK